MPVVEQEQGRPGHVTFDGLAVDTVDDRHAYGEMRMKAVGEIDGELFAVAPTDQSRSAHHVRPVGEQKGVNSMEDLKMSFNRATARADVGWDELQATIEADVQRYMGEDGGKPDGELNVTRAALRQRT